MTIKEFIEIELIQNIGKVQLVKPEGLYYLSFFLISAGIEFLGACLDEYDFHAIGQSGKRFRLAISELFPSNYHEFNDENKQYDLFINLRCGLLHAAIPKSELELIQQNETSYFHASHLEIKFLHNSNRLVLVAQNFYDDFRTACNNLINGGFKGKDLNNDILYTT